VSSSKGRPATRPGGFAQRLTSAAECPENADKFGQGGFYTTLDGVPYSVGANSSGDFTSTTWAPTPGWHTLEVAPIDKAGNLGAESTFSFGTGAGAMNPPIQNARSTSAFPVEMTAPPNATGATLSWKLAGETTWRAASNVTKAGSAWTGTVTTASGHATAGMLLWNATSESDGAGTLSAPAVVQLRGCFQYSGAADSCTGVRTVELVPSALGGNFPTAAVGPATVALFTGEASISSVDAADSKAGLGRSFRSYDASTVNGGVFGAGWSEPGVLTVPSATRGHPLTTEPDRASSGWPQRARYLRQ